MRNTVSAKPMTHVRNVWLFIWVRLTVFSTLKQADVCKHTKWMLNVSGMFFIVGGVC